MSELDELRAAIEALEAQRTVLSDAAVAAAVVGLRERLAALEQAAQPAPEGERKQITVMFADLSGFTALAETADAEDIRNLVNACFERVGEVVTAYLRLVGDEAGAAQAEAEASATARELGLDWLPTPPPTPIATAVSGRGSER